MSNSKKTSLDYSPQLLVHILENNYLNYQSGTKSDVCESQLKPVLWTGLAVLYDQEPAGEHQASLLRPAP